MDCRRAGKLLSAYADGELAGETRDRLARHLEGCRACEGLLHELAAVGEAARDIGRPDEAYYADLTERVMAGVRREAARGSEKKAAVRTSWARLAPALPVLLVAVVAAGVLLRVGGREPMRPSLVSETRDDVVEKEEAGARREETPAGGAVAVEEESFPAAPAGKSHPEEKPLEKVRAAGAEPAPRERRASAQQQALDVRGVLEAEEADSYRFDGGEMDQVAVLGNQDAVLPSVPPSVGAFIDRLFGPGGWSVLYSGDLNRDGLVEVVAVQPRMEGPGGRPQALGDLAVFSRGAVVRDAAGRADAQVVVDRGRVTDAAGNSVPVPAEGYVMTFSGDGITVRPVDGGEGMDLTVRLRWDAARGSYLVVGL